MIYVHSLVGRAFRYYPERKALAPGGNCLSFRDLEHRVAQVAAALSRQGFGVGDRVAFLLPNGPEYIELVYACGRLGIIGVPLNTRLSVVEIDRALVDANPRSFVRHSTLPVPSTRIPWERVLDREPWEPSDDLPPEDFYDPEAILMWWTVPAPDNELR
jgi:acyl-CoA synthetase (AMP-forming)/AMP-acid ligase II